MNTAAPLFIASADKKSFAKIPRIASATANTVRLRSVATRTAVARLSIGEVSKGGNVLWWLLPTFRQRKVGARAA